MATQKQPHTTAPEAPADAAITFSSSGIEIEDVLTAIMRSEYCCERLGHFFTSEITVANSFYRAIGSFCTQFYEKHGKLPSGEEWQTWYTGLTGSELERDGIRDYVQRLIARPAPSTPEFFIDKMLECLQHNATKLFLLRVNQAPTMDLEVLEQQLKVVKDYCYPAPRAAKTFPTVYELLRDETLCEAPVPVVPKLGWRGLFTLLSGVGFIGKTELAAQGVLAAAKGHCQFLGEELVESLTCVWYELDEHLSTSIQRFERLGCNGARRIHVLDLRQAKVLDHKKNLVGAVEDLKPTVVIVDSLIAWARVAQKRGVPKPGDDAGWAEVVRFFSDLAHKFDVAVIVLHHARKDGGGYRNSGEIAAAADVLVEMSVPTKCDDETVRCFATQSRIDGNRAWAARLDEGRYTLATGVVAAGAADDPATKKLKMWGRIEEALKALPGQRAPSQEALRREVGGNAAMFGKVLEEKEQLGVIRRATRMQGRPTWVELRSDDDELSGTAQPG